MNIIQPTLLSYLKGKVERGEPLSGMIIFGGQLGDSEIVDLAHVFTLIDTGV